MSSKEDFYTKLKDSLDNTTKFPAEYLYKFIVPSVDNKVMEVKDLFKDRSSRFSSKTSKTGKYVSISIHVQLLSSDEVISYYRKAEGIEGIISL